MYPYVYEGVFRGQKRHKIPEGGVTGGCEVPAVSAGNELRFSVRAASTISHGIVSLTPKHTHTH